MMIFISLRQKKPVQSAYIVRWYKFKTRTQFHRQQSVWNESIQMSENPTEKLVWEKINILYLSQTNFLDIQRFFYWRRGLISMTHLKCENWRQRRRLMRNCRSFSLTVLRSMKNWLRTESLEGWNLNSQPFICWSRTVFLSVWIVQLQSLYEACFMMLNCLWSFEKKLSKLSIIYEIIFCWEISEEQRLYTNYTRGLNSL